MSDRPTPPAGHDRPTAAALSMRFPADDRYRPMLETAVRIYLRPVCRSVQGAPEIAAALAGMVAEVAGRDPIDVVLACRLPELEVSVTSGGRRAVRTFRVEVKG